MKISKTHHKTKDGIVKRNPKKKVKYIAIYDNGKPYEEKYSTENGLKNGLKDFYLKNKDNDDDYDVKIYDTSKREISESQWIQEMIADIMEEVE